MVQVPEAGRHPVPRGGAGHDYPFRTHARAAQARV